MRYKVATTYIKTILKFILLFRKLKLISMRDFLDTLYMFTLQPACAFCLQDHLSQQIVS